MVVVDVQHNGQVRGQFQEGLGKFTGLNYDIVALAGLAVAIDQRKLPPMTADGSRPANSSAVVIMEVVVVLPWVPETQMLCLYRRLT